MSFSTLLRRTRPSLAAATVALATAALASSALPASAVPPKARPALWTSASPASAESAASASSSVASAPSAPVVSWADVDGDGRADRTTIAKTTVRGDQAWRLTTRTASGRASTALFTTPFLFGSSAWYGASRMDGVPGSELVVRSGFGAHTQVFRVFTWRGGRLVAQREPGTGEAEWTTDGALTISQGYRLATSGSRRTLTSTTYLRQLPAHPDVMTGTIKTFTWTNGTWRLTRTVTNVVPDDSEGVADAYGWHVPGLPLD